MGIGAAPGSQGRLTAVLATPKPRRAPIATLRPVWAGRAYLPLAGVVAVAAAALLAAGCGGDDSAPIEPVPGAGDNQGPAALSKSDFIAQGDAICGEANAALSALDTGTAGSDPEFQATQELQITRSELQSLESLPPPSQNRSALDELPVRAQDQVDALSRKQAAVDQGDDPAAADAEVSSAAASAQAAAQDYGFQDCANAGEAPTDRGTTTAPAVTTTTTPTTTSRPDHTHPAANRRHRRRRRAAPEAARAGARRWRHGRRWHRRHRRRRLSLAPRRQGRARLPYAACSAQSP